MDPFSYRQAGVDIEAGDEAPRRIAPLAPATLRRPVIGGIAGFAGVARVNDLLVHDAGPPIVRGPGAAGFVCAPA